MTILYVINYREIIPTIIGAALFILVLYLILRTTKQCPTDESKRINYDEVEVPRQSGWYSCKRTEFSKVREFYYYNTSDRWEDPESVEEILADKDFFLIGDKIR